MEFLFLNLHSSYTQFHGLIFQVVLIVTLIVLNTKGSLQRFSPIKLPMTQCTVATDQL
jgi:hypothetical protein